MLRLKCAGYPKRSVTAAEIAAVNQELQALQNETEQTLQEQEVSSKSCAYTVHALCCLCMCYMLCFKLVISCTVQLPLPACLYVACDVLCSLCKSLVLTGPLAGCMTGALGTWQPFL